MEKQILEIVNNKITNEKEIKEILDNFINSLDKGNIRVAEKLNNEYKINQWVKQGILLLFKYLEIKKYDFINANYIDKFEYKGSDGTFRLVPGGTSIRKGSFIGKNVIIMPPSFINVGAYVDEGTMIDSTVLVGSCAQIGKNCHISAGTMIGGVIEPLTASPVIIEDNCFVGGNCGLYEGVHIEENCVIGTGTIINASTPIIDINTGKKYYKKVPKGSVVIPGGKKKVINGEEYVFQTPLIVKNIKDISDKSKVELNQDLRNLVD